MSESNNPPKNSRSEADLAQMVVRVARAVKLDGAFIVRGDGLIQTAGAILTSPHAKIALTAGLGTGTPLPPPSPNALPLLRSSFRLRMAASGPFPEAGWF